MYQTNRSWGDWGNGNFSTGFSRVYGGYVNIAFTHNSSVGNGFKIAWCGVFYQWVDVNTGNVLFQSSVQGNNPTTNVLVGGAVWMSVLNDLPAGTNARLKVISNLEVTSADESLINVISYEALTGIYFASAPGQIAANYPENAPVPVGGTISTYCGLDTNGSNTRYEAVFLKPDGSVSQTLGPQTSNHFYANAVASGNNQWKARAINDQGTGAWSSLCSFPCYDTISGTLSANLDPIPAKPIHTISASFSCSSGHTIAGYSWTLKKLVNGSWQTIGTGSGSTYSQTNNDDPSGISYQLTLVVTGVKNGITSQSTFVRNLTYEGLS
jgi:hypothetical protein